MQRARERRSRSLRGGRGGKLHRVSVEQRCGGSARARARGRGHGNTVGGTKSRKIQVAPWHTCTYHVHRPSGACADRAVFDAPRRAVARAMRASLLALHPAKTQPDRPKALFQLSTIVSLEKCWKIDRSIDLSFFLSSTFLSLCRFPLAARPIALFQLPREENSRRGWITLDRSRVVGGSGTVVDYVRGNWIMTPALGVRINGTGRLNGDDLRRSSPRSARDVTRTWRAQFRQVLN